MDRADDVRSLQSPRVQLGARGVAQVQDLEAPTGYAGLESSPTPPAVTQLAHLNFPVLLMNVPLSLSAQIPNNAYMEDLSRSEREICLDRAIAQFQLLYKHITQHAIVYLLPSTPGFQDQPYVSNLGAVLPHLHDDTVLISRFRSPPRVGEERTGADFFNLMNFTVVRPPETFRGDAVYFEGEADLKHVSGDFYIGAHGMRTSHSALAWASEHFGMEIVPIRITNPYLYHLDCSFLRIDDGVVLFCTAIAEKACLRATERHCEIIDVSLAEARAGMTNCLLLGGEILCDSPIGELSADTESYAIEKAKIARLETICSRLGRTLRVFCMSEFYKSGALLSCLIMHIKPQAAPKADETELADNASRRRLSLGENL